MEDRIGYLDPVGVQPHVGLEPLGVFEFALAEVANVPARGHGGRRLECCQL